MSCYERTDLKPARRRARVFLQPDGRGSQNGATLFLVLAIGIVAVLLIMAVLMFSGRDRALHAATLQETKDFYAADAGFNYIQNRVAALNRTLGPVAVQGFLATIHNAGWQRVNIDASGDSIGYFRIEGSVAPVVQTRPFAVGLTVLGSSENPARLTRERFESVRGMIRAPTLAQYARYIEGPDPVTYGAGSLIQGEVLITGDISTPDPTVTFTRMVGTGGTLRQRNNVRLDFGARENIPALPTLAGIHINTWDPASSDFDPVRDSARTYAASAARDGIVLFPRWGADNANPACNQAQAGPCNKLFASCFDTNGVTWRSPVLVAGSAVYIPLEQIQVQNGQVRVTAFPVIRDMRGRGGRSLVLGEGSTFTRSLVDFSTNGIIYFPGDLYVSGTLSSISVTLVSGDDMFLLSPPGTRGPDQLGPASGDLVLGLMMQDRLYIHESSARDFTIRAAIIAENDEIIYDSSRTRDPNWRFGYVCGGGVYDSTANDTYPDFDAWFARNFIFDNRRVAQSGFGREPDEECAIGRNCNQETRDRSGFVALPYARPGNGNWRLRFFGSLITRLPGDTGPVNCSQGWNCPSEPGRVIYTYDDVLGTENPPSFPSPRVDDRVPTHVVGYKRLSQVVGSAP